MQNIDGLKKSVPKISAKAIKPKLVKPARVIKIHFKSSDSTQSDATPKHIALFGFFDYKQLATIAITFIITFVISIATSQSLASYQNPSATTAEITNPATRDAATNNSENLLAVTNIPNLAGFNDTVLDQPGEVFLPKENLQLPNPLQQRREFLQKYLTDKGSVLADHVDALSEQSQWKLIIAISRAESSFCKHKENYNCWGIGGAWNLKKYKNYDEAVADVNRILEQKYISSGLNTPGKIVKKYVGHQNDNWEYAVQQELDNLKDVE